MEVSEAFFNIYARILTEVLFAGQSLLYGYWLKPFVKKRRAAYVPALVYWIINLAGRYIDLFDGFGRFAAILALIIPFIILFLLDDKCNLAQKIFLCVVFYLIRWLPIEMMNEIGSFEGELVYDLELFTASITAVVIEFAVWNLIQYGVSLVLLYISIRILHRTYRRKKENLSWQELIMLLMPAGSLLLVRPIMLSYYKLWMDGIEKGTLESNIHGDIFRLLFCILSYLAMVVMIYFYQQIKDNREEEFLRHAIENQIEETHRHIERIEDLYDQMRAMRHDMGNHMTVIKGLAESGKDTELAEYIGKWKTSFDELKQTVKSGNAITDVVLSEYAQYCSKDGIAFESRFVYPDELDLDVFDMCVVLSNALQNALESSKSQAKSHIVISSSVKDRIFIAKIKNRIAAKVDINEDGLVNSTKDASGHGYGLKNIRNIARKYNGDIEILQEESDEGLWFKLNVMMVA